MPKAAATKKDTKKEPKGEKVGGGAADGGWGEGQDS